MKLLGALETGIFPCFMMVHYVVIQVHQQEVIILMKIYTGNYLPPYIVVDVESTVSGYQIQMLIFSFLNTECEFWFLNVRNSKLKI